MHLGTEAYKFGHLCDDSISFLLNDINSIYYNLDKDSNLSKTLSIMTGKSHISLMHICNADQMKKIFYSVKLQY